MRKGEILYWYAASVDWLNVAVRGYLGAYIGDFDDFKALIAKALFSLKSLV